MSAFPVIGRSALRQGRVSIPGQIYVLTTTTHHRQRLFLDSVRARIASGVIYSAATWGDAKLLAWVLMPDHWHGLLQLGDEPLARVMNRFKGNLTRALNGSLEPWQRVWDRSFHDHALRADEDVRRAARYIVANPVRAGLAKCALDYPYWNAIWLDPDELPQEPAGGRCSCSDVCRRQGHRPRAGSYGRVAACNAAMR